MCSNSAYDLKIETAGSGGLDVNSERNRGVKNVSSLLVFAIF